LESQSVQVEHRRSLLKRLRNAVLDHEQVALEALHTDLGKPPGETHVENGNLHRRI
jgi:hypothetical protein